MSTLRNYMVAPKKRATNPQLNTRQKVAKAKRRVTAIEVTLSVMDDLPEWTKEQCANYEALSAEWENLNVWIARDCQGDL